MKVDIYSNDTLIKFLKGDASIADLNDSLAKSLAEIDDIVSRGSLLFHIQEPEVIKKSLKDVFRLLRITLSFLIKSSSTPSKSEYLEFPYFIGYFKLLDIKTTYKRNKELSNSNSNLNSQLINAYKYEYQTNRRFNPRSKKYSTLQY